MRLGMVLTPLQPTTVIRKSIGSGWDEMRWFIETKVITIGTWVKMGLARWHSIDSGSREIGRRGHLGLFLRKTLACEFRSTNTVSCLFPAFVMGTRCNRILCNIIGECCPRLQHMLWSLDYSTNPFKLSNVTSGPSTWPIAAMGMMARTWAIGGLSCRPLSFLLLRSIFFPTAPQSFQPVLQWRMYHGRYNSWKVEGWTPQLKGNLTILWSPANLHRIQYEEYASNTSPLKTNNGYNCYPTMHPCGVCSNQKGASHPCSECSISFQWWE